MSRAKVAWLVVAIALGAYGAYLAIAGDFEGSFFFTVLITIISSPLSIPVPFICSHFWMTDVSSYKVPENTFIIDIVVNILVILVGYLQWFKLLPILRRTYGITVNQILIGIFSLLFLFCGFQYISSECGKLEEILPGACDVSFAHNFRIASVICFVTLIFLFGREWRVRKKSGTQA